MTKKAVHHLQEHSLRYRVGDNNQPSSTNKTNSSSSCCSSCCNIITSSCCNIITRQAATAAVAKCDYLQKRGRSGVRFGNVPSTQLLTKTPPTDEIMSVSCPTSDLDHSKAGEQRSGQLCFHE